MGILDDHYQTTFPLHEAWKERCRQTGTEFGAINFEHNAQVPSHRTREDIAALGLLTLTHTSVTDFPARKTAARPHSPEEVLTDLARGGSPCSTATEATPPTKPRRTRSPPQPTVEPPASRKRRPSPPATQAKGSEGPAGRGCRPRVAPAYLADQSLDEDEEPPKVATPRAGKKRRASVSGSKEDEEEWGPSPTATPRGGVAKAKKRAKLAGWTPEEIEKGSKRESPTGRTSPKAVSRPTICALPATPVAPGSLGVVVTLAQGQEATEDAEYTARIRSNGRSAKLNMVFTCPDAAMADHLRKLLKYGSPLSGGSCTVGFCLRYSASHEQIVMKTRGQTPNWVSLMAPGDNVKNATKYTQSRFQIGSESPHKPDAETMPTWSHLEVLEALGDDDCAVRADVMIVTNITSFVHEYKHFEWLVELVYTPGGEGGEPVRAEGVSGPLEYYAKPKTSAELQAMQTHKLERLAEKERRKFHRVSGGSGSPALQVEVPVFSPRGTVAESPRDAGTTALSRTTPREAKEGTKEGPKQEPEGSLKENLGARSVPLFAPKQAGGVEEASVGTSPTLAPLLAARSPVKELNMALVSAPR